MEEKSVGTVFTGAKSLSSSPLGIIALFILLIYGIAALVFGISVAALGDERLILIWFLVGFPPLVFLMFAWLVAKHHTKLYGPSDFVDQKHFLELQVQYATSQKTVRALEEVSNVAIDVNALKSENVKVLQKITGVSSIESSVIEPTVLPPMYPYDPQKGRWGEKREDNGRKVEAGPISPLRSDADYFNVPLRVVSTDSANPLKGKVTFHLHDTFRPSVREIIVVDGVAKLNVVSFGAFTVGVETEDGTRLEIDLADQDITAPLQFKQN